MNNPFDLDLFLFTIFFSFSIVSLFHSFMDIISLFYSLMDIISLFFSFIYLQNEMHCAYINKSCMDGVLPHVDI